MPIRALSLQQASSRRTGVLSWRLSLLVWTVAAALGWGGVVLLLQLI